MIKFNIKKLRVIIIVIFFAFLNVFSSSGFANLINFNLICVIVFALLIYLYFKNNKLYTKNIYFFSLKLVLCCIYLFGIFIYWNSVNQLVNFSMLFGIIIIVNWFSKINWYEISIFKIGMISGIFAVLLNILFLPIGILSNWNSNSSILILPVIMFSISFLYCSGGKKKYFWIFLILICESSIVYFLENRSVLIALWLFTICLIIKPLWKKKNNFRIIYICVILINIILPFIYTKVSVISNMISKINFLGLEKVGLNGREYIWNSAIDVIAENILFGNFGIRSTYYHNFSLDVLTQFGFIGWIIFFGTIIYLMEILFEKNSEINVFLVAFLFCIFLNTFENVFVCNNYVILYPYIILSVPMKLEFNNKGVRIYE